MIETIYIIQSDLNDLKTVTRYTARAIIFIEDKLLMAYSSRFNDYMFPGGGINPSENEIDGLKRELNEELGIKEIEHVNIFLNVHELRSYTEEENLLQVNKYFLVLPKRFGKQALEAYEMSFGLEPKLVSIDEAISANQLEIIRRKQFEIKDVHPYATLNREIKVLEYIKEHQKQINKFFYKEVI